MPVYPNQTFMSSLELDKVSVPNPGAAAAIDDSSSTAVSKPSNSQQKLAHQVVGMFNGQVQVGKPLPPELQPLPPAPPQTEIDEDGYVKGISKIIQRDFFPDLEKLRVQKQLYDAVDLELDDRKAAKLAFQLAQMTEPGSGAEEQNGGGDDQNKEFDTRLSLDQFQAKYTSEDNESFNQLVQKENEKKRQKFAHFYPSQQRLLEVTDKKMIEGISRPINTWEHTAKSALMYGPEGVPMTLSDLPPSRAGPKQVVHSSTRIDPSVLSAAAATTVPPPPDIMESMAKAAHTQQVWRNMAAATPALHATGANRVPLGGERDSSGRIVGREPTPLINGYKLMPDTPDIRPHQDVDPSALITWGMVESTPLLVDSMGKAGGPSFSMAPTPKRESLAKELGEKASQSLRKRTAAATGATPLSDSLSVRRGGTGSLSSRPPTLTGGGRTPIGSGGIPSTSSGGGVFKKPLPRHVSPAVQSLKNKLSASGLGGNVLGGGLKAMYSGAGSASPATFSSLNATPSRSWTESGEGRVSTNNVHTPNPSSSAAQKTPLHHQSTARLSSTSKGADRSQITDNLLDLN